MTGYHRTPPGLASALARYAPRQIQSLLDPAVGGGSLLLPFISKQRSPERITCVDCDGTVAKLFPPLVAAKIGAGLDFIQADFLQWADKQIANRHTFDCIVVNPPFFGRKWVKFKYIAPGFVNPQLRAAPIELAFLVKSIELLRSRGRLLAVLPSSAVTSVGTRWFREFMLHFGSITRVHEVRPNTFSGVEGRIYLLTFDKDRRNRSVILCNSDLMKPQKICMPVAAFAGDLRFDYSFHKAVAKQKTDAAAIRPCINSIEWAPITQLASVFRGNVEAPFRPDVLHTTDREGAFWVSRSETSHSDIPHVTAAPNDVLIARVGRRCANSAGLYCGQERVAVSDCVLVVRPKGPRTGVELLFAIRVLLKRAGVSALLERGTGASYITIDSLSSLEVPATLHLAFPRYFRLYRRAIRTRCTKRMVTIELLVAGAIGLQEE